MLSFEPLSWAPTEHDGRVVFILRSWCTRSIAQRATTFNADHWMVGSMERWGPGLLNKTSPYMGGRCDSPDSSQDSD